MERIYAGFLQAGVAQNLLNERNWDGANDAAAAALQSDADNASAKRIGQAALAEIQNRPGIQDHFAGWTSFVESRLTPFLGLLTPFLLAVLVGLIVSRLLVLLVPHWPPLESAETARKVQVVGLSQIFTMALVTTFGSAGSFDDYPWLLVAISLVTFTCGIFAWKTENDMRSTVEAKRLPEALRPSLMFLGLLPGVFLAALYLPLPPGTHADLLIAGVLLLGVLAGLLGVSMTAWWLATRLRVEVKVTHADDKQKQAEASLVSALLYELGAKKPEGLEVPKGTDSMALTDAIAALPENAIVKGIKQIISAISGMTPWVAFIEGEEGKRTVSISRNGRMVNSAIIDETPYSEVAPVNGQKSDSEALPAAHLCMASAFILFTIANEHPMVKRGLANASDWRSIGLQYIATTFLAADAFADRRKTMLARAHDLDPGNLAVQLALRHTLDRYSTDAAVLIEYRKWLARREQRLDDLGLLDSALTLRTSYLRTVVATNAVFAGGSPAVESVPARISETQAAFSSLEKHLKRMRSIPELDGLILKIRDSSVGLERLLEYSAKSVGNQAGRCGDERIDEIRESLSGIYNDACFYASRHSWARLAGNSDPLPNCVEKDDKHALALLRRAVMDPDIGRWMHNDPQLADFRRRGAYREQYHKEPVQDFYSCGPIQPYATRLQRAGYGHYSMLAQLCNSPDALADVVPADTVVRKAIIDFAYLRSTYRSELEQRRWSLEMLDQLAAAGLANARALRSLPRSDKRRTALRIAESLASEFKIGDQRNAGNEQEVIRALTREIQRWINSVRVPR